MGDFCDSDDLDDMEEDLLWDEVVDVAAVVLKMGNWNIEPENKPFMPETHKIYINYLQNPSNIHLFKQ